MRSIRLPTHARSCFPGQPSNYGVGVGVGVPAASGRVGRRLFALSSAASGEAAAAFAFAAAGGTGTLGAMRGIADVGKFGVRDAAGDAAVGGVVTGAAGVVTARGGADGRSAGVKLGRCLTADSGGIEGVAATAGVLIGGGTRRCGGAEGVMSLIAGDAAGLIVVVGGGTMGGVARKSIAGEGRTLGGVDGAAVAAGAAAVGEGDATEAGATEGLTFGCGVGDGRVRTVGDATGAATVAEATGVALAAAAGRAVGVALAWAAGVAVAVTVGLLVGVALAAVAGRAVGLALAWAAGVALAATVGLTVGVALALATGLGLAVGVAAAAGVAVALAAGVGLDATGVGEAVVAAGVVLAAGVVAAAAVAAGVVVVDAVSVGFTNRFGGAFGGGVASALILVRARSAAERSAIAVHPFSISTCATRSFTRRGRGISRTSTISGAETSSSLP